MRPETLDPTAETREWVNVLSRIGTAARYSVAVIPAVRAMDAETV
jgi:hypothetical protein